MMGLCVKKGMGTWDRPRIHENCKKEQRICTFHGMMMLHGKIKRIKKNGGVEVEKGQKKTVRERSRMGGAGKSTRGDRGEKNYRNSCRGPSEPRSCILPL